MKRLTAGVSLILMAGLWAAVSAEPIEPEYFLRIYPGNFKAALQEFNLIRNYDIAGIDRFNHTIDILVSENEYFFLKNEYQLEVLATPDQMGPGRVDPEYKTPDEVEALLTQYHSVYPSITDLISIGLSEEGRDIWAIKISDNPSVDEDEPVVLFNGQHHAREVMCAEVCLDIVDYLCSNYGSDPSVNHWVDTCEIWVIPIVNVDGVNYVFTAYDMWRKDRHVNSGSSCLGIDPNRDYPQYWNSCGGSSGDPCSDTYRGAFPADSDCVAHMIDFGTQIQPWIDLSYHSYAEIVIYPYGCSGSYTPEHDIVSSIGQSLGSLLQRDDGQMGYSPGTPWELLYDVDGGDIDWYYAQLGTMPFVIEMNSSSQGFLPDYDTWRDITVERMRPGWQFLLDRVDVSGVTGLVTDACTGTPVQAQIDIMELPLTSDEAPRMSDSNGRYFRFLIPGEYHLEISAAGYATVTIPVTAANTMLNQNIPLVPNGSYGLYVAGVDVIDMTGDQDDVIDPGETVQLQVYLLSVGNTTGVSADLSCSDPYVTINTGHAQFGDISDGATGSSISPHFDISVDPDCPTEHTLYFELEIDANETLCADTGSFSELVSRYVYECPIYEELLDSDPGYTILNSGTGGWAYGHPTSGPGGGHTGQNCYATNLSGDYGNNGNFRLTSTAFDCTNILETELVFWRYLQNESGYDDAYVQVSGDNTNWSTVWQGYAMDSDWREVRYDISAVADGNPTVYVRWQLTSDGSVTELGFHIDDIRICGKSMPADVPDLRYYSSVIDDSSGNNDGQINPGETIILPVTLINDGTDASSVHATLSTTNPHVSMTSDYSDFPDISHNATGETITPYAFTVSPEATDGEIIPFRADWVTAEFSGAAAFNLMIVAPALVYNASQVIDPTVGDGDGILDPGETAGLLVTLNNTGNGSAHDVSAVLSSNHPEYITITDDSADFPDIDPSGSGTSYAPHFEVEVSPSTPDHTIIQWTLSISAGGYVTTDHFQLEVTTSNFAQRYLWSLDTDPGWTTEGQWAWGQPQGSGGDPSSGYTGVHVYGYNLAGSYANSMPEYSLTSSAINCSNLTGVEVRFMRWLGVESATYDHAYFRLSTNGTTWSTIWSHTGSTLVETSWNAKAYDISSYADGQATVYLRWVMGTTDSSLSYCGWNIDDIEIWAETAGQIPTSTPAPATNTPAATPTRTPTGAPPTPTGVPPSPTHTPIPPTNTPVMPTYTPVPPTNTPVQPTNTSVPTDTPVPPTHTAVPPTNTAVSTETPTMTPVESTNTPVPTETPEETPTATPTQEPVPFWAEIALNDDVFESGEEFLLQIGVHNQQPDSICVDQYLILDVMANYFFHPSWNQSGDYTPRTIDAGYDAMETILEFTWPADTGSADNLRFWLGYLNSGTMDLACEIDWVDFGYR